MKRNGAKSIYVYKMLNQKSIFCEFGSTFSKVDSKVDEINNQWIMV
jgi:hypothetical protein